MGVTNNERLNNEHPKEPSDKLLHFLIDPVNIRAYWYAETHTRRGKSKYRC